MFNISKSKKYVDFLPQIIFNQRTEKLISELDVYKKSNQPYIFLLFFFLPLETY